MDTTSFTRIHLLLLVQSTQAYLPSVSTAGFHLLSVSSTVAGLLRSSSHLVVVQEGHGGLLLPQCGHLAHVADEVRLDVHGIQSAIVINPTTCVRSRRPSGRACTNSPPLLRDLSRRQWRRPVHVLLPAHAVVQPRGVVVAQPVLGFVHAVLGEGGTDALIIVGQGGLVAQPVLVQYN